MAETYRCVCGATLRYRQDMIEQRDGRRPSWLCGDCRTPIPNVSAERIRHQHPS